MIKRLYVYETHSVDPYRNIATEKYLLETVAPDSCVLYLWQNKNTVVIGRNQNAWAECRTGLLEEDQGHLARRLSGGGAVYHDIGNLNFTFLTTDENYDVDRQLSVIQTACRYLNIDAVKSGRNDLLADGRKFSGNAFYHAGGKAYHHGTLLFDADMEKLSRYLTPPKAKLQAKGVQSVRSRVVNLKELSQGLTCDELKKQLRRAFSEVYGLPTEEIVLDAEADAYIQKEAEVLSSWQWLYGQRLPFSCSCEDHFPWGHICLELQIESGAIRDATVYSDAMDWSLADTVSKALKGCRPDQNILRILTDALESADIAKDIARMLTEQLRM